VPGMNSGLSPADPTIVAAFRSALIHQWAIVALIFVLLLVAWGATRSWAAGRGGAASALAAPWREPGARRLLRIGFGVLWVFDGILQAQPQMAGGLPQQVIEPAASSSPAWVQHLPSDPGGRGLGLDPGRDRHVADLRSARLAVAARRAG
jgi:hypothetical protein